MMIRLWRYKGKDYTSEWSVRQAVFETDRVSFGEVPEGEEVEFWKQFDVTYVERDYSDEEREALELDEAKRERAAKVASLTVEVDGMTFDADEISQTRMTRAIAAAEATGLTETVWVLADNRVVKVTLAQMKQALAKSMLAMGELWTVPYATRG